MRVCVVDTTSIMFDVGVIATVGFLGAAIASRVRVPIIIGYIVAGMLIGPNVHVRIFDWSYDGVLGDSDPGNGRQLAVVGWTTGLAPRAKAMAEPLGSEPEQGSVCCP